MIGGAGVENQSDRNFYDLIQFSCPPQKYFLGLVFCIYIINYYNFCSLSELGPCVVPQHLVTQLLIYAERFYDDPFAPILVRCMSVLSDHPFSLLSFCLPYKIPCGLNNLIYSSATGD